MMQKIVVHRAGSYDHLQLETHPIPSLGPEDVLVEVEAIGINYADCIVRMGLYASAKKYVGWPITPGFEVAGKVLAIGENVEDLKVGEEVMAVARFGGYTSHLVTPRHQVFPLPKGFNMAEAAGFPSVFLTAYYAMFVLAAPRKGQSLLVHSAAGGVGSALVQLGKLAGCHVVGVVGGAHKVQTALQQGADVVIDKSSTPLWPAAKQYAPEGYHAIFDANGVETLGHSFDHLASPGRLVIYGFHTMMPKRGGKPNWLKLIWTYLRTPRFNPLDMTGTNRSVMGFNLSYLFHQKDVLLDAMHQLLDWVESGDLCALPTTSYPLSQVAQAHRDLESGTTTGKLILHPDAHFPPPKEAAL